MPLPAALLPHLEDPEFWAALLGPGSVAVEVRISLPVAGGYGLVLDLAGGEQALGLREPHAHEPVQLAWAAPDRPHPGALRFADVELACRVIALDDPTLPHPGLPIALLASFAPPDDAAARATVEAAFRSLRRSVPAVAGPEQDPLPLFAAADWWPRPPSDRVLSEGEIADYLRPRSAGTRGLTDLVRHARQRLARLPREPWCDPATVRSTATRIVDTGDLSLAKDLLSALEAAGCDHPTVLDACTAPVVGVELCWVAETLADATPGTAFRRLVHPSGRKERTLG